MEITVKITADDKAVEFSKNLGGLVELLKETVQIPVDVAVKESIKPASKNVTKQQEKPVENVTDTKLTMEDVRAIASEYAQKDPKKLAKTILQFGVGRVPELKPEQFEAFVNSLKIEQVA